MFKKRCSRCNNKVDRSFDYCPHCANPMKNKREEYGLLGKSDNLGELNNEFNSPIIGSGIGNSLFEKMFTSAMKMVEKELQKAQIEEGKIKQENNIKPNPQNQHIHSNFELFINGKKVNLPSNIAGIQIEQMPQGNHTAKANSNKKAKAPVISEELLAKSSKLPRKEAKTRLARTADRVIYELDTPGIESLNNVLVNQLENSIEVKVYTDKVVFFKTLQVKLPLMQYSIKENLLILEFKAQ